MIAKKINKIKDLVEEAEGFYYEDNYLGFVNHLNQIRDLLNELTRDFSEKINKN